MVQPSTKRAHADGPDTAPMRRGRGRNDPYRVLGVAPTATDEQVRAAYRRRSRDTHPDTAPRSRKGPTFLEVRAAYDQVMRDRSAPPVVVSATLSISTFAAIAGGVGALSVAFEHPHCGLTRRHRRLHVPAGLTPGRRVVTVLDGVRVVATVEVRPHAQFELAGRDVRTTVTVAAHLAERGGWLQVMTPHGIRRLRVPPHTCTGSVLVVPGGGVRTATGRGDLLCNAVVARPAKCELSTSQRRRALSAYASLR